jgi:hypothetical protein
MKNFRIVVLVLLMAIAAPFVAHHRAWARQTVQQSGLRIVSPKPGETLAQTFVAVQYQPLAPPAAGMPTYELRLDNRDPVQTTDTSYTFDGLKPGSHDLIVQIVDANGTPVANTRSEVKFVTANPSPGESSSSSGPRASLLPPLSVPGSRELPADNDSLPLLSVIGFGILVGGVISALRTRPAHK